MSYKCPISNKEECDGCMCCRNEVPEENFIRCEDCGNEVSNYTTIETEIGQLCVRCYEIYMNELSFKKLKGEQCE